VSNGFLRKVVNIRVEVMLFLKLDDFF